MGPLGDRATGTRVFALSLHAEYACGRTGACCTAGWTIPIEPPLLRVRFGLDALVPDADGVCGHFDRASGLCRVHRDEGEATLPVACRQFPRITLIDDRGIFVRLSHFCPTAARLLVHGDGPLAIVEAPAAFPAGGDYDGLDARGHWPPLVRRDLLFDYPAFDAWERFVVATCARDDLDVDGVLQRIAGAAERIRAWTPDRGPLAGWVAAAARDETVDPGVLERYAEAAGTAGHAIAVRARVAADARNGPDVSHGRIVADADLSAARGALFERTARRYVAARTFGSWSAYQARGLRTMVAEMVAAVSVLRVEASLACAAARRPLDDERLVDALRAADGLLVHGIDRMRFLTRLQAVE
jgi:hypothetical protein